MILKPSILRILKILPDIAIKKTANWYKKYYQCENILEYTFSQIEEFQLLCENKRHER